MTTKNFKTKASAAFLATTIGLTGLVTATSPALAQPDERAADSSIVGCSKVNAALVVDNSTSILEYEDAEQEVKNSYVELVLGLASMDPDAKLTIFPVYVKPEAGNYHSRTFNLGDDADMAHVSPCYGNDQ